MVVLSPPPQTEGFYLYSKIVTPCVIHWNLNLLHCFIFISFSFFFFIGITGKKEGKKIIRKTGSFRLNQFLKVIVLISRQDDVLLSVLKVICSPSVTNLLIMFW